MSTNEELPGETRAETVMGAIALVTSIFAMCCISVPLAAVLAARTKDRPSGPGRTMAFVSLAVAAVWAVVLVLDALGYRILPFDLQIRRR